MAGVLAMGRVALTVHDLDRISDFYERVVGLHRLKSEAEWMQFGVAETVLLELRQNRTAPRRSPRDAGLFHTAFLLPARADLGAWTKHAAQTRAPVVGASDHGVSEAIYLVDPEGNGVEIYADRAPGLWERKDGMVLMPTESLDVEDLIAAAASQTWQGFPAGSAVGHVHLQVGAIAPAEAFYTGILGLPVTCRYPGGTFYASGDYHHHLATNIWNSRGARMLSEASTGLADVEMIVDAAMLAAVRARLSGSHSEAPADPARLSLRDPWGTSITLVAQ